MTFSRIYLLAALFIAFPAMLCAEKPTSVEEFFKDITGEWVGVCEQQTDGEQADNKYFHVIVSQIEKNTYEGKFNYFRYDADTGVPIPIGKTEINATINPDGTVTNRIIGEGIMLVQDKPRQQKHEIVETLVVGENGTLHGSLTGKISVMGLPLGLGRNGQIHDGKSEWKFENGFLTIRQTLKAGFKVVFFSKNFEVEAFNTASRGSDLVAFMKKTPLKADSDSRPTEGS